MKTNHINNLSSIVAALVAADPDWFLSHDRNDQRPFRMTPNVRDHEGGSIPLVISIARDLLDEIEAEIERMESGREQPPLRAMVENRARFAARMANRAENDRERLTGLGQAETGEMGAFPGIANEKFSQEGRK